MDARMRRRNPRRFHLWTGFCLAAMAAVLLWWGMGRQRGWGPWLIGWLAGINVVAMAYYGFDKAQAQREGASRVPESVLHTFSFAGGSAGALLGMRLFRHKTMKGRFRILFWCIVAAQAAFTAWVVWWF